MVVDHHTGSADMRIFIVEDSPAVLERLADMVREVEGIDLVGDAANYEDAVKGILATRPDLAILDIKLADDHGSGIDVLQRVKPHLPDMKAIVLSNYATPQHVKASADAGAEYFLDKSGDFERIAGILEELQDDSNAGQA
jgi:DNA-binding NarL/FixJ family response regulator